MLENLIWFVILSVVVSIVCYIVTLFLTKAEVDVIYKKAVWLIGLLVIIIGALHVFGIYKL